jgi:hypothetical protein
MLRVDLSSRYMPISWWQRRSCFGCGAGYTVPPETPSWVVLCPGCSIPGASGV